MITEFIGWTAATVLLATIGRQVYSQWRSRSSQGVKVALYRADNGLGRICRLQLAAGNLGVRSHQRADAVHGAGQWIYPSNRQRY
jgi:hypothetical protein